MTAYTPEKTANYENLVKVMAHEAMQGRPLIDGAVGVDIALNVPIPSSWSKKKQQAAIVHQVLPTSKPDTDNCVKAIFDALNGVVWVDDKQVVDLRVVKRYSDSPRACVSVLAIG